MLLITKVEGGTPQQETFFLIQAQLKSIFAMTLGVFQER